MYLTSMLELISGIIEATYIICAINFLLPKKYSRIKFIESFGILAILYLVTGSIFSIYKRYDSIVWMNLVLLLGLNIVVYIIYKGNIVKKLLAFIIPHAVIRSIVLLLNQIQKQIMLSNSKAIVFFYIKQIILLVIFLILYYCCRKLQYKYKNLTIKYSRVLSNVLVFYFTSITVLYFYFIPSIRNDKLVYSVAALGSTFGIYTVIHLIINWEIKKNLDELKILQNQQRNYYNALQENIDRTRKFRHDIANHINMVQVLKEENRDFFGDTKDNKELNFKVLRVLFDYYHERSKERNIHLKIEDFFWESINISEYDLVTICKNLLENAWEACINDEETVEKYITMCLKTTDSFLYITVENSKATYQKIDKERRTTKREKELHGLGMNIVSDICKRYQGKLEYIEEKNIFWVKVKLKIILRGV